MFSPWGPAASPSTPARPLSRLAGRLTSSLPPAPQPAVELCPGGPAAPAAPAPSTAAPPGSGLYRRPPELLPEPGRSLGSPEA